MRMREKLKRLPGVQIVMAQPISDRVDEMVTGVRSDVAVKVFGDDLDRAEKARGHIARSQERCRAPRISASSG
jgi:cobalt-zinc-cadmium resistance protein CzcA